MLGWELLEENRRLDPAMSLIKRLHDVFLESVGTSQAWSRESLCRRIQGSSATLLLKDGEGGIFGFALYKIPSNTIFGSRLCWESSIAIKGRSKGSGLSNKALRVLLELPSMRSSIPVGWLGGRTQNPIVVHRYLGLGHVYPFDELFTTGRGEVLLQFVRDNIEEIGTSDLDLQTGICRRAYREGKLGDYPMYIPGDEHTEQKLASWGFVRSRGDAIVVLAEMSLRSGQQGASLSQKE